LPRRAWQVARRSLDQGRLRAKGGDAELDARDVTAGVSSQWLYSRGSVLHEFLSTNRGAITARAREKVAARPAPRATEDELASGIPLFLEQLTETLRVSHVSSPAMADSATAHGRRLLSLGFTVAQVVHDYGSLCLAVTELADETRAPITAAEFHIFNHCLDDAIAQAVTEYGRRREQTIADEGTERLGNLAHELRSALGAAMLSFQTLKSGSVGIGGSTAGLLDRSLRRLAALIDSSFAQVRLEAGTRSAKRISLREVIEEVEVAASMEASSRGLALTVTPVQSGVEVRADRQLLAAAVTNLLQNAFKFTRANGHIWLRISPTDARVRIEIEDECGGLAPGVADDLFRPFEQRGSDRTGLGLGLSISRKSVEADGGEIYVRELPGTGCVFTIDLPRV
jgi:signal transduction histidine kinase